MEASELTGLRARLLRGGVIVAHPLLLDDACRIDEDRQRRLTRYYLEAGAAGIAVGVHTTQFDIHDSATGLYRPVLAAAMDVVRAHTAAGASPVITIAGVVGGTRQAVYEAGVARDLGYDAVLLSLGALRDAGIDELLSHCTAVSAVLPVVGFYLQPAVGGRVLPLEFWRAFFAIDRVVAAKVSPFDRYRTLDVIRALGESGRADAIALYTGNDDTIVHDLLSRWSFGDAEIRFRGGLLGHWAYETRRAVELVRCIEGDIAAPGRHTAALLRLAGQITEMNAAVFDAANGFAGCLAGIHEMLHLDGFVDDVRFLHPRERLSPGQSDEILRVRHRFPHLLDSTDHPLIP